MLKGDLYVVDTVDGSYVLVRSQLTAEEGEPTDSDGCGGPSTAGARYETVPPGLVDAWLTVAREGWAWPREIAGTASDDRRFAFHRASDEHVVATATCSSDVACTIAHGDTTLTSRSGSRVTADQLSTAAGSPQDETP